MSTADKDVSMCANCGKEGDDVNNICNKCKMVKYCNAACKKKHRHKHKKDCEEHVRLAVEKHDEELRIAAELHDKKLFKQAPPREDCPICFLRMPTLQSGWRYQTCCGKVFCSGCSYAPVYDDQGNQVDQKCPFCRTPDPESYERGIERIKIRVELNDPMAIYNLGIDYRDGTCGYSQDYAKALEFWHRAADLGYAAAHCNIGYAYNNGEGVVIDKKKANHYYELAVMGGNLYARYNLGNNELKAGNVERAVKHFIIAAASGDSGFLNQMKRMYSNGYATKEDYTKALQSYQTYLGEIKSKQRGDAAAADNRYRYY